MQIQRGTMDNKMCVFFQPDANYLSSCMALDGEFLPAGDIQLQVLPQAARVLVK